MSGGGPLRKHNFKIEAFKSRVELDPKYAEQTWKVLEHAIHEIYNHNTSVLSFEELYKSAHTPTPHPCKSPYLAIVAFRPFADGHSKNYVFLE
jgi:cullin 3